MAWVACLSFALCAVVGRIGWQYRLTGDHGMRFTRSGAPASVKLASGLLATSVIAVLVLVSLEATGRLVPRDLGPVASIVGALLCTLGILGTVVAQVQMGSAWRIGVDSTERTELVTHGVYAYARNPIYGGVILFGLGLLLLIPHASMLVALALGYVSIELQVRWVEEPHMRRLHGADFEHYCKRVNRYLPFGRPRRRVS